MTKLGMIECTSSSINHASPSSASSSYIEVNAGEGTTRNSNTLNPSSSSISSPISYCAFIVKVLCRTDVHSYCLVNSLPLRLALVAVVFEVCSISVMYIISSFYQAIIERNESNFIKSLLYSVVAVSVIAMLRSYRSYLNDSTALHWRVLIIRYIHSKISNATNKKLYRIIMNSKVAIATAVTGTATVKSNNSRSQIIDNIDQRITQDVDELTTLLSKCYDKIVVLPFIILFYTLYLWYLCGWIAPTICYCYFIIGIIFSIMYGKAIINLVYQQEICEGDYRYSIITFCRYIDNITSMRSCTYEMNRSIACFDKLKSNKELLNYKKFQLAIVTNWFDYIGSIVNYASVGMSLFLLKRFTDDTTATDTDSAVSSQIVKGSYACLYLINSFSTICESVDLSVSIAGFSKRIVELILLLDDADSDCDDLSHVAYTNRDNSSSSNNEILLKVSNLLISSPSGALLINPLNLRLHRGMRLLVTGSSGCGKSTLMKALANIIGNCDSIDKSVDNAIAKSNSIQYYCNDEDVSFCCQKPYCFKGTLVDNVTYNVLSSSSCTYSDKDRDIIKTIANVKQALIKAQLSSLLKDIDIETYHYLYDRNNGITRQQYSHRQDDISAPLLTSTTNSIESTNTSAARTQVSKNWDELLSYGQMQKLSIARIFYQSYRKIIFLDESTNGIDEDSESAIYRMLQSHCDCLVSFGHRPSLKHYHTHELHIHQDHTYELKLL